ncbi:MAG: hypothetical protein ACI9TF_001220 [Paracrocinitomix sp.]|jgi:hypothetical protein
MRFEGPAAGHRLLQTSADGTGKSPVGAIHNCGNGYTPWGAYLTAEEDVNGYFWEETEGTGDAISGEWLQVDGSNDQMLLAPLGSDEIKRFLVGPGKCDGYCSASVPSESPRSSMSIRASHRPGATISLGVGSSRVEFQSRASVSWPPRSTTPSTNERPCS